MWTKEEINSILIDPVPGDKTTADLFCYHYGVETSGNVSSVQVSVHMTCGHPWVVYQTRSRYFNCSASH